MIFIARISDNDGVAEQRAALRDEHLAFLRANEDTIKLAGSVHDGTTDDPALGGMWIVNAGSRDAAIAVIESDPFFKAGIRSGYTLQAWKLAPHLADRV